VFDFSFLTGFRFRLFCDWWSVGQSVVVLGDRIRFSLLSDICGLHVVGHPHWQEDWSVIYSYNLLSLWSKSRRTHDHILLSHLRLLPGGPRPYIYIPLEQGGPVIPWGIGFPFCRILRPTGLRWRYSNPRPDGSDWLKFKLHCDWRSVGQFVLVSGPLWGPWPDFNFLCLTITFFFM
jgi:hypothetical protein